MHAAKTIEMKIHFIAKMVLYIFFSVDSSQMYVLKMSS